jgi:hypothetical protein
MPLKFDIHHDNFNYYFLEQTEKMGEMQKALLPRELLYKIYIKGHTRVNAKSSSKLTFLEKLLVLTTGLNKRWVLVIEDEDSGVDIAKYKKLTNGEAAEELMNDGLFVLSNGELTETFQKLNSVSTKAAYNYLTKVKNKNYLQPDEYKRNMNYLARFVSHYEAHRKKIAMENDLTMAEWLTLLFLYDGEEKVCSVLYKDKFKYSYNSSSTKFKLAFGTLQSKGFIIKYGIKASSKFQITALGRQKFGAIMAKYVVNC